MEETEERSLDWSAWRQLLRYVLRYRLTAAGLAATAVLTAMAEASFPLVTRQVIDEVSSRGAEARLLLWAGVYAGLVLLFAACVWIFIMLGGRISTHVSHDIRRAGFTRLQELSFSFYDRRSVGWLMARMTSDCDRLARLLAWGCLDLLWGLTMVGVIAVVMLLLDAILALVVLAVVPLLALVSLRFQRLILRSARRVRRANSRLTASYNEGIMGVRTTKTMVRERANLGEFQQLSSEMRAASVRNALETALFPPLVLTLGSLGTALALWFGGVEIAVGALSLGTLVAFMNYASYLLDPIREIAQLLAQLQMAQAAAERVLGLINTEPEIRDSPAVRRALEARQSLPATPGLAADGGPERIQRLAFRDVTFAHSEGEPVLRNFKLQVEAGEQVALVGPTGGGKTSIVSLLCRFYEPSEGQVLLDGTDYRERSLAWWQSQLGIVLQQPHLFSGTVRQNIRYGRLDASDEEVESAARLVGAHDFIERLEDGYSSQVGEGGNRLSTGQKQLVSFARAVLADPQVLVMDEATSSVDTETERRIQAGLKRVLEGRTSFVIAHRLSTIRGADRILVIEQGRIVEQGSHAELMAADGRYRELYLGQRLSSPGEADELWRRAALRSEGVTG